MHIDVKLESDKIADELINGTVDQACEDYRNVLDNYCFITSSPVEKKFLTSLGTLLAKRVRKQPESFLLFCKKLWYDSFDDGRELVGSLLASLEILDPESIIPEVISLCRSARSAEDVDILVTGFEPVFVRDPAAYFPLLRKYAQDTNIWVKRLIIVTAGHIMYRHKSPDIVQQCLELLRPAVANESKYVRSATSWIIGSFGVRADQKAIAAFMQSFEGSENPVVVGTFTEAFKRSKIAIQKDVSDSLIPLFEDWSQSEDSDISRNAFSTLRLLRG